MKSAIPLNLLQAFLVFTLATPATAFTRIRIDTVPAEYKPSGSPVSEPVSMQGFRFEVNRDTLRARVVVDYTYPDEANFGPDDSYGGPRSTLAQLPGLVYDREMHAVVYDKDGKSTVCAVVQKRNGYLGTRLGGIHYSASNTGSCTVRALKGNHSEDDGWDIHKFQAIDVYFEVPDKASGARNGK